jgi:hypothetical protein
MELGPLRHTRPIVPLAINAAEAAVLMVVTAPDDDVITIGVHRHRRNELVVRGVGVDLVLGAHGLRGGDGERAGEVPPRRAVGVAIKGVANDVGQRLLGSQYIVAGSQRGRKRQHGLMLFRDGVEAEGDAADLPADVAAETGQSPVGDVGDVPRAGGGEFFGELHRERRGLDGHMRVCRQRLPGRENVQNLRTGAVEPLGVDAIPIAVLIETVPCDHEVAVGVHRDRGKSLPTGGIGVDLELAAHRLSAGQVSLSEYPVPAAILATITTPGDDEVATCIHADRRKGLPAGRVGVDLKLGPDGHSRGVESLRLDLASVCGLLS